MSNDAYKEFYVQGLQALVSAGDQGKEAAAASTQAATNPELKTLVEDGSKIATRHAETLKGLLKSAGGGTESKPNLIMEGIRAGTRQIVDSAKDKDVRDAAVISSAQIALHYYIAAYGSLASTAKHLGLTDDAQTLKSLTDEMKSQDELYTKLAESGINRKAA